MISYIKKKSKWDYTTSSGAELSASVGFAIGAGKGNISLTHPDRGRFTYEYLYAGGGAGLGFKTGILSMGALSYSREDFSSRGGVYILNKFPGNELEPNDLTGYTLLFEFSLMAGVGVTGTALLLGIDPDKMLKNVPMAVAGKILSMDMPDLRDPLSIARSAFELTATEGEALVNSGNAVLIMGGASAGISVGASLMGCIGGLWLPFYQPEPINLIPTIYEIPSTPVSYFPEPITLSDDVLFDFNSHILKPEGIPELTRAAGVIRLYPNRQMLISGYTDSIGKDSYNITLSKMRAEAVKQWIVYNTSVPESNITTRGQGEGYPAASNTTPEGRQKNRRVEILILDH